MQNISFIIFSKEQFKWNAFYPICFVINWAERVKLLCVYFSGFFVTLLLLNYSVAGPETQHRVWYQLTMSPQNKILEKSSGNGFNNKNVLFAFLLEIIRLTNESFWNF